MSLNQIVRDAFELLAYELQVSEIDVRLDLAPDAPLVWGDEDQLYQVVVNLAANAHQACARRRRRRVTATTRFDGPRGRVCIRLSDTGPGIAPEIQARIFEPFFTTKPEGQGTGLGLALTRSIVEGHGGVIHIFSPAGEGASFYMELPAGVPQGGGMTPAVTATASPVRGRSILVVDDEPGVAAVLAEALTGDEHVVETAENGAVALEKLALRPYDLVICGSGMPVLNGPDLYHEVARQDPALAERFIFVVGDILTPRTQEFLEHVSAPQILEPFTVDTIKHVVRRVLAAQ